MINTYEIEIGNAATVTDLVVYQGTANGAVRAASKIWKTRADHETILMLFLTIAGRRCRPLRIFKVA